MEIITIPHPTLRKQAKPVERFDKKLVQLIKDLGRTLQLKENPRGVGLAAPQVDYSLTLFATNLDPSDPRETKADEKLQNPRLRVFLNPTLADHSDDMIFGQTEDDPRLEGCLSIPGLYGPVPRWQWAEYTFLELADGEFVERTERFTDFHARVMQHEYDHLQGILFTDYSLQYDLPVYRENPKTEKLQEVSKTGLEAL